MKYHDIEIETYSSNAAPYERVRIVLTERAQGRWGRVRGVRRITLDASDFRAALKAASLFERVEVRKPEPTTIAEDAAMFEALCVLPSPSQLAKSDRNALFNRLRARMDLP